ncbi:hypothetical protein EDD16DRAFT_1707672 [Pisolithus croceorrhizus]|nr:hypothetical protein EDD16DRAFT_1707672 [Pisolithus croceorrhizus]
MSTSQRRFLSREAGQSAHRYHTKQVSPPHPHANTVRTRILRLPSSHSSALHNPFPYDFYFKQGSPLETRFNIEERRRERRAFGAPFGTVKLEERDEATELMEMSMRDEADESMPRIHEADVKVDLKNLNRKGQRNLYAMLRTNEDGKDVWRLPTGPVGKGELLHVVWRLEDECGRNMDTWLVSRNPIGVYHPPKLNVNEPEVKDVVFFYKAHILAGKFGPSSPGTKISPG